MAVSRTILPRKGFVEPQHGAAYEADVDQNWVLCDSLMQDANDVSAAISNADLLAGTRMTDFSENVVIHGFELGTSTTLVPAITPGVLFAQGKRYAPAAAPTLPAAPANTTRYLFYNSSSGFYYASAPSPTTPGDCFLGTVTTSASTVTAVTTGPNLSNGANAKALVQVMKKAQINFAGHPGGVQQAKAHGLGYAPTLVNIRMTSPGAIWESALVDATNVYLTASEDNLTAIIIVA